MRYITTLILGGSLVSCILTGCIDENYDLSDIDTNVSVQVKDLVIPVNLDAIQLKSVIDLGVDGAVRVIDGQYAAFIEGSIVSSPLVISPFVIPKLPDQTRSITVPTITGSPVLRSDGPLLSAPMFSEDTHFKMKMSASGIDPAIRSLDKIGFDTGVRVEISVEGLSELVEGVTIRNLTLQMPPHCKMTVSHDGVYDPSTGIVSFPEMLQIQGTTLSILFHMSEFRTKEAGVELIDQAMEYMLDCSANGSLAIFQDQLRPGVDKNSLLQLPALQYDFGVYYLSDIEVNSVSGEVVYAYPELFVSPVKLDDMPDVLKQPGTCLEVANPQIYVSLNNPLFNSGVNADISLALTPEPASSLRFETGISTYGEQNVFCLAPTKPEDYYYSETSDYSQAVFQPFEHLGSILKGDGLPQQINIKVSASVNQKVADLKLGEYDPVEGNYTFYAPLALTPGSEVFYADTIAGWNDEEVDAMTIRRVRLTADVVKDIPYAIDLTVLPIDVDGKVINNCSAKATLCAQTGEAIPLDVEIEGEIQHLDGIVLKAYVQADRAETLSPEMSLKVSKVRVTATGSYDKEL